MNAIEVSARQAAIEGGGAGNVELVVLRAHGGAADVDGQGAAAALGVVADDVDTPAPVMPGRTVAPVLVTLPVIVPLPERSPPAKLRTEVVLTLPPERRVNPAVCVKPPLKCKVPLAAVTMPALLTGTCTSVVPAPVFLSKAAPVLLTKLLSLPARAQDGVALGDEVAAIFENAATVEKKVAGAAPDGGAVIAERTLLECFYRRAADREGGGRRRSFVTLVGPAPLIVPPVHSRKLETVSVTFAALVKVPSLSWNDATVALAVRLIVEAMSRTAVSPVPGTAF